VSVGFLQVRLVKKCNGCNKNLSEDSFPIRSGDKRRSTCKVCHNARVRRWYSKDKPYRRYKSRQYASTNRSKRSSWNKRLKANYGITADQFDIMRKEQEDKCLICSDRPDKGLVVDHCHKTGKVRGLICANCNSGIGFLRDDINLLEKAIDYLERGKTWSPPGSE